ncbi:hypothetical protein FRB91_009669 [Serendipita sp. 411]|nr:hypothetical protein FRC18_002278 [Serendipita sp. 400]KAG8849698.1 hypothetical protein FRB91_009669 [Serendipita sp. 411]
MSSVFQPFDTQEAFGIISATGEPIPTPEFQTVWPAHTLHGHPNREFISSCFRYLSLEDGERLRTLLNHILNSVWWRTGQFDDAPVAVLDPFIRTTQGMYVCQFCNKAHTYCAHAMQCVRSHIDI